MARTCSATDAQNQLPQGAIVAIERRGCVGVGLRYAPGPETRQARCTIRAALSTSGAIPSRTLPGASWKGTAMSMTHRLGAEFFGTFWLVLGGCGSAVLAAAFPDVGIGLTGVSLAFGLTVVTMAYAVGHISGGHFNPAVTLGLWAGGRFPASEIIHYWVAQIAGGIAAAAVLYLIASGKSDFALSGGFASNGYAEHSPGQYTLVAALVCEVVMTF